MSEALVSLAAVTLAATVPVLAALVFLALAARGPEHRMKRLRFEAGNPPRGPGRPPVLHQYLGYVLVFIALDPVFMLLFVLPSVAGDWGRAAAVSLASIVILLPPLRYALRYASRREYWSL